jgi:hypothetical protein
MIVDVVDGTYELFRHFYGQRRFNKGQDKPFGAVVGVLQSVLQMVEHGATHVGVATCGLAIKPVRASSPRCSRNSIRWKKHSPRWVSSYGP